MEAYLGIANGDPRLEIGLRVTGAVFSSFVVMLVVGGIINVVVPAYRRAFQGAVTAKVLRDPPNDPRMSWVFAGHPAVLFLVISIALDRLGLAVAWPGHGNDVVLDSLFLGAVLVFVGSLPGIFLDYCTFRVPAVIVPVWWLTSFLQTSVVAFFVLYGRPGHGTHVRLPNLIDLADAF